VLSLCWYIDLNSRCCERLDSHGGGKTGGDDPWESDDGTFRYGRAKNSGCCAKIGCTVPAIQWRSSILCRDTNGLNVALESVVTYLIVGISVRDKADQFFKPLERGVSLEQ